MTDLERIEQKLDLIIDAFGLGKNPRMSPVQRKTEACEGCGRIGGRRIVNLTDAQRKTLTEEMKKEQPPVKLVSSPSPYLCKHCRAVVFRESSKAWVKSFCTETGKDVHLQRLKNP